MASVGESSTPPTLRPLEIPSQSDVISRPRANSKSRTRSTVDPVLRNAIRYTISAREYETLHRYVLSRSRLLKRKVPSVNAVERYMEGSDVRRGSTMDRDVDKNKEKGKEKPTNGKASGGDTYNARAIRDSLRVFMATGLGVRVYEAVVARLKGQKE